jgi:hypothetical protein
MVKKDRESKAEQFRAKGSNILNDKPFSINDFLNDSPLKSENTQTHNPTTTQIHTVMNGSRNEKTNDQLPGSENEPPGRLHLQIRQDLIEKLLDTVFRRKRDPKFKGRDATQRSVIEDALEHYFRIESYKSKKDSVESK